MENLRAGIKQEIKDYLKIKESKISPELMDCLLDNLEDELAERIHESVDMCLWDERDDENEQ